MKPDTARAWRVLAGPAGLVLAASATVWLAYGVSLDAGFHWDDYHFNRPWTTAELGQVLAGTWDPAGIEVPFYRPVTVWWYALRFDLLGLNARAQHAVSIAGMGLCAVLVGVFVRRETGRARAGWWATVLYAVHPALVYAQGAWLTDQMHLLASLTVLAALLVWQRVRNGGAAGWLLLAALQVLAFGIKEDTIMLLPALVVLTVLRARFVGDASRPRIPALLLVAGVLVALVLLRQWALGGLGGYRLPTAAQAWENFHLGLDGVLRVVPVRRPWQAAASAVSTGLLAAGALTALVRRPAHATWLFVAGLTIAVAFDLPFALVTKAEQLHLVTLGAVIALTGAIEIVLTSLQAPALRRLATATAAAGVLTFVPLTRDFASDFQPCSAETLRTDGRVLDWGSVPAGIREWLAGKPARCAAGEVPSLLDDVEVVAWTYGPELDERGEVFRWTSDQATLLVARSATEVPLDVRATAASRERPVTVVAGQAGGAAATLTLESGDWTRITVALAPDWRLVLQGTTRIDLAVSPVFVPREVDPASPDQRRLGVQLRIGEVRMAPGAPSELRRR
ncbi:MAG: hypothetical protein R2752_15905 [Vicinamibacterales bacterium]